LNCIIAPGVGEADLSSLKIMRVSAIMEEYLRSTEIIDWRHPEILSKAEELASGRENLAAVARCCFECQVQRF
jgi:hypothetical protein